MELAALARKHPNLWIFWPLPARHLAAPAPQPHRLWRQPLPELLRLCGQPLLHRSGCSEGRRPADSRPAQGRATGAMTRRTWTTAPCTPAATRCCAPPMPPAQGLRAAPGYAIPIPMTGTLPVLEQRGWLEDYACTWPSSGQRHEELGSSGPRTTACGTPPRWPLLRQRTTEEIGFWKFVQYEFSPQWRLNSLCQQQRRIHPGRYPHLCLGRFRGCLGGRPAV